MTGGGKSTKNWRGDHINDGISQLIMQPLANRLNDPNTVKAFENSRLNVHAEQAALPYMFASADGKDLYKVEVKFSLSLKRPETKNIVSIPDGYNTPQDAKSLSKIYGNDVRVNIDIIPHLNNYAESGERQPNDVAALEQMRAASAKLYLTLLNALTKTGLEAQEVNKIMPAKHNDYGFSPKGHFLANFNSGSMAIPDNRLEFSFNDADFAKVKKTFANLALAKSVSSLN